MTYRHTLLFAGLLLLGGAWPGAAIASDAQPAPAAQAAQGDIACTRCHDELETKPILSIYQTKHGVRGDARTPLCQGCHGASEGHLKNKQVPPDVTFGENKSEVRAQDAACLNCHKGDKRTRWQGSQLRRLVDRREQQA